MSVPEEAEKYATSGVNRLFVEYLGQDGATAAWALVWLFCGALSCLFLYYTLLLGQGDAAEGSRERRDFDNLRARLAQGGKPAQIYRAWLPRVIAAVDRFFGDADKAHLSSFPRFFLLRLDEPAPLWTGAAYDRCLLLALLYPILVVLFGWVVSNQSGTAEKALGLPSLSAFSARFLVVASIVIVVTGSWFSTRLSGWKSNFALSLAVAVGVAVAVAGVGVVSGGAASAVAFALAVAFAGGAAGGVAVAVAVAVALAVVAALGFLDDKDVHGTVAFGLAVALAAAVLWGQLFAIDNKRQGVFATSVSLAFAALCAVCADCAPQFAHAWNAIGPLLLFLVLLTVINAPFDFVSIGLTRGLLRLGVQKGELWPYILAFVDVALGLIILMMLAAAMVIGVQAFNDLATLHGSKWSVLEVNDTLGELRADPGSPKVWWIYGTLFSTLIPSLLNLAIGAISLTRGIPMLSRWMASLMDPGVKVPAYNRAILAPLLTAQWAAGILLTLGATVLLVLGAHAAFPRIGHIFLDEATSLAAINLPGKLIGIFRQR